MEKSLLLLGGYGNLGRLIASYLLPRSNIRIVLAGRDAEKAVAAASDLNLKHDTKQVSALRVDATNPHDLDAAFANVDLVVFAASTTGSVGFVASAALEAGIDYFDTLLSSSAKIAALRAIEDEIERAGLCFVTDGGSHPGLPAALVHHAAAQFDVLEVANVSALMQVDWKSLSFSEETSLEFINEIKNFRPLVLRDGNWRKLDWKLSPKIQFGAPFGERICVPMFLEEMRHLPHQISSLRETGLFVAGFNPFVDYLIIPLSMAIFKLFPKSRAIANAMGRLLTWGLRAFSKPPFCMIMLLEAVGYKDGAHTKFHLKLSHENAYAMSAAAAASSLLQYLNEGNRRPGLWFQAQIIDPARLIDDLKEMKIEVELAWLNSPHSV